jgi:hypothetical protein
MKTVYQYHPETKVYLGQANCKPCPLTNPEGALEKDWIAPGSTTEEPPLEPKEGYAVIFKETRNKWDYLELPKESEENKEERSPEAQARLKRNILLRDSDFSQLVDVYAAMSEKDKSAWINYRQLLREVPEQKGFPDKIKWPNIPTK